MGLEALFDEAKKEKKIENINYEKGKNYCCEEVCEHINAYIEYENNNIKYAKSETKITSEGHVMNLSEKDVKGYAEFKLELLKELKDDINNHKPYCKCE